MREVPGFPGYLVTPDGDIYSVRQGFPLKVVTSMHKGYLHAQIKSAPGRQNKRKVPVHQVVLLAFKGARPSPAHGGRHLDGNVLNNAPDNLEWGTQAENVADAIGHGTHVSVRRSERVGPRKLLDTDVAALRVATPDQVEIMSVSLGVTATYALAVSRGRYRRGCRFNILTLVGSSNRTGTHPENFSRQGNLS